MRIVMIYPNMLYPGIPFSGAIRAVKFLEFLGRRHEVVLFTLMAEAERALLDRTEALRARIARYEPVPIPPRSIARKLWGYAGPLPQGVYYCRVPELRQRVEAVARTFRPDVVHVEFTYMGEYGACFDPAVTARVLVDQELTFRMHQRRLELGEGTGKGEPLITRWRWMNWLQMRRNRRFEPRIARRFDHVLSITPEERDALWSLAPDLPIDLYPNIVDTAQFVPREVPERADTLLFVGNYIHTPNVDALGWMVRELFPAIRARRPGARLRLVGAHLDGALAQVLGGEPTPEGVEPVGFVDDLVAEVAEAAVFFCPLRMGGGMRGKNLEALSMAKALVTTPVGVEGTVVEDGVHARVAAEGADLVDAAISLLGDAAARRRLGEAGRALVRRLYDATVVFEGVEALYRKLADRRRRAR